MVKSLTAISTFYSCNEPGSISTGRFHFSKVNLCTVFVMGKGWRPISCCPSLVFHFAPAMSVIAYTFLCIVVWCQKKSIMILLFRSLIVKCPFNAIYVFRALTKWRITEIQYYNYHYHHFEFWKLAAMWKKWAYMLNNFMAILKCTFQSPSLLIAFCFNGYMPAIPFGKMIKQIWTAYSFNVIYGIFMQSQESGQVSWVFFLI